MSAGEKFAKARAATTEARARVDSMLSLPAVKAAEPAGWPGPADADPIVAVRDALERVRLKAMDEEVRFTLELSIGVLSQLIEHKRVR